MICDLLYGPPKGAELVIVPNACALSNCLELGDARLAAFRGNAMTNMMAMAMTNYPYPKYDGHSCAYDQQGNEILMMDSNESIAYSLVDLDALRQWRQQEFEVRGKPARRPEVYYSS